MSAAVTAPEPLYRSTAVGHRRPPRLELSIVTAIRLPAHRSTMNHCERQGKF
jgi:hypothetical protein